MAGQHRSNAGHGTWKPSIFRSFLAFPWLLELWDRGCLRSRSELERRRVQTAVRSSQRGAAAVLGGLLAVRGSAWQEEVRVRVTTAFSRMLYPPGASVAGVSLERRRVWGQEATARIQRVSGGGDGPPGLVQLRGAAPAPDRVASRRSGSARAERPTLVRSQGARPWPAWVSKPGRR
jgi:hypothetical protein